MKRLLLLLSVVVTISYSSEINLSIENFVDDGNGNVTFDLMMSNSVEVSGFQMQFLSGNGVYDGGDDCLCDPTSEDIPTGCDECYYDYGIDKVSNKKESDTSTSGYIYGCEDSGICSDTDLDSGDCEDEGVCSDSAGCDQYTTQDSCPTSSAGGLCSWDTTLEECYLGKSSCLDVGTCSDSDFDNNECDCISSGGDWQSANYYWIPDENYFSFNDTETCFENVNENGVQLRWDYYNPDGNDDNYASVDGLSLTPDDYDDDQRCYVPEFGSDFRELVLMILILMEYVIRRVFIFSWKMLSVYRNLPKYRPV